MNVVDTSGWLEYFTDGPNSHEFSVPLEDISNLIVPAITICELFKVVYRERDEDAGLQAVALMRQGREVVLNAEIALLAAKTSIGYKIPMADSIILITAHLYKAVIWTQDSDFEGVEGVKFFPKQKG